MIIEYVRYRLQHAADAPLDQASAAFEAAYLTASASLDASPHCLSYELTRCVEEPDRYILRIVWDSTEGHLQGFRRSAVFGPFLQAIRPYISQIEEMQHYALTAVAKDKHP